MRGGGDSATPAASNVAKYVGTWQSGCFTDARFIDAANGNGKAYVKNSFVAKENSGTVLGLSVTQTVYAATDSTCSGAVQATVTRTGLSDSSFSTSAATKTMTSGYGANTLTYLGALVLSGKATDKFDFSISKLSSFNSTTTLGTIQLNTADFPAGTGRETLYLEGTKLTMSHGSSPTADPTALSTDPRDIFTKQ